MVVDHGAASRSPGTLYGVVAIRAKFGEIRQHRSWCSRPRRGPSPVCPRTISQHGGNLFAPAHDAKRKALDPEVAMVEAPGSLQREPDDLLGIGGPCQSHPHERFAATKDAFDGGVDRGRLDARVWLDDAAQRIGRAGPVAVVIGRQTSPSGRLCREPLPRRGDDRSHGQRRCRCGAARGGDRGSPIPPARQGPRQAASGVALG